MAKFPDDLEAKAFEVWRIWHKDEEIAPPPAELTTRCGWPGKSSAWRRCTPSITR